MARKVKHKHSKHHKKSSKFSLFRNKIADTFKEIVEAPEEPIEEIVEDTEEEVLDPEEKEIEDAIVEEEFDPKRDEILQALNIAVDKWKQTGEVGIHLEAPISLREKVRNLLTKKPHSQKFNEPVVEELTEKPINTEKIVREEWQEVVHKIKTFSKPSERDEIEKIYKELGGK